MDWKDLLGKLAPTAAALLGGPLAGIAVQAVGEAIGVGEPTQKKIEDALASGRLSGEQLAALKLAELNLRTHLEDNGIKLEEIAASDRDSARKREATLGDKTTRNLAYLVVLGGGGMIWATLSGYAKADTVLAGTLIGYAVSEMKQVLTYYFGSSAGSDKKTDLLMKGKE